MFTLFLYPYFGHRAVGSLVNSVSESCLDESAIKKKSVQYFTRYLKEELAVFFHSVVGAIFSPPT